MATPLALSKRLFSWLLLLGLWMPLPASAGLELCPDASGPIELRIRFYDPAQLRLIETDSGREAARWDNSERATHIWQAPADTPGCYTLLVKPAAGGGALRCQRNDEAIGYATDAHAPLSVLIHYRHARLKIRGPCGALPDQREAAAGPPLALPSPVPPSGRPADIPPTAIDDAPPAFAWPPPRPSTRRTLARHLVTGNAPTASLGKVADRLQAALETNGYTEYGYYRVPGGFALATRLERIYPDGRSMAEPKRWEMAGGPLTRFDLGEYLRVLFDAERGHFRVIVFIVTPHTLAGGTEPPSAATALNWPLQGAPVLPAALRSLAYGSAFQTHALIYEFEVRGQGQAAQFKTSSTITGEAHLRRANILGALQP